MLFKNVAGQKIHVYAYDSTTGDAKTGDAANITGYVSLDGTANAIDDTNPAEVDATNMPGVYVFDLTQAETNCNSFALYAKSATANIRIEPIIGFTTGAANSLSVNTAQFAGQTITCAAGVTVLASVGTAATSTAQTGDTYALANGATGFTAIDTVVDAIKAKTDSLTFTVAGFVDANFKRLNDSTFSGGVTVPATIPTGGITSDSFAAGAITAAAIATGAIDADSLAADAGTEIGAAVKAAIEAAGSHLTLILEDTGTTLPGTLSTILGDTDELQKAITDGGRTDLLIDAIKAKTDLMLDAAAIRTAVGLASANLDTQIATLATATNLATLDTLVDKMAPLLIGTVTGAGTATEVYVYDGVTATVTADADGNVSAVVFS